MKKVILWVAATVVSSQTLYFSAEAAILVAAVACCDGASSSIIELADLTKSGKTHWCRCLWCMRRRSPFIVISSTPDDQKCSR